MMFELDGRAKMSDEYRTAGKSIAELNDLGSNDPWQSTEVSDMKLAMDEMERQQAEIIDQLRKDGIIQEEAIEDADLVSEFKDPADDEDPRIANESILTLFWRMMIPNKRLKEIVDLEPSIAKIGLTAKNTQAGCWIAFTSKRVAERIGQTLTAQGITNDVHSCDISGNRIGTDVFVNQVTVTEWRPWKPSGPKGDITVAASEIFYCLLKDKQAVRACFVPESYWNEHRTMFDGDLGIGPLLSGAFQAIPDKPYSFISWREYGDAKLFLDRQGFRENLIFHAYVNENIL